MGLLNIICRMALREKLSGGLKNKAGKLGKQRRTLKQVHADLVALGFTGSYGRAGCVGGQTLDRFPRHCRRVARAPFPTCC